MNNRTEVFILTVKLVYNISESAHLRSGNTDKFLHNKCLVRDDSRQ